MLGRMDTFACNVIATFGGGTAVSRFTSAPVSTVHSWKHNGIPPSRLAHLQLIAEKEQIAVDWETGLPAGEPTSETEPSAHDAAPTATASANNGAEIISPKSGGEAGHGHPFTQAEGSEHPSCATSSRTLAPPPPSPASPDYSGGKADAA